MNTSHLDGLLDPLPDKKNKPASQSPKVEPIKKEESTNIHIKPKATKESRAEASSRTSRVGKSSNPDYIQTTALVRKDIYKRTRMTLMDREDGRDYSDLVDELLANWLTKPK